MEEAIRYSETGHLCLSTLHANNTVQAIEHIANFFTSGEMRKVNMDLSLNLRAIISQRLVRDKEKRYLPATEVLINTPYIAELISRGEFNRIREAMEAVITSYSIHYTKLYDLGALRERMLVSPAADDGER